MHLKNGLGEVGDAHERHADAVADRVVRGESAEGLLDPLCPACRAFEQIRPWSSAHPPLAGGS